MYCISLSVMCLGAPQLPRFQTLGLCDLCWYSYKRLCTIMYKVTYLFVDNSFLNTTLQFKRCLCSEQLISMVPTAPAARAFTGLDVASAPLQWHIRNSRMPIGRDAYTMSHQLHPKVLKKSMNKNGKQASRSARPGKENSSSMWCRA